MKTQRKPRLTLSQPKPDLSVTLGRIETLIAAQTKLVEQMTALVEKLANPPLPAQPSMTEYRLTAPQILVSSPPQAGVDGPRDWAEADREEGIAASTEGSYRPADGHNLDASNAIGDLAQEAQELGPYEDDPPPAPDHDGMWRKRLQLYGMKFWQPDWGPMPGQEGCQVPSYLLNGRR